MVLNRKKAKVIYPHKATMNLYVRETNNNSLSRVLPVALILALFVALFTRFAVIDRLAAVAEQRRNYETAAAQLSVMKEALVDFDQVQEDYYRYTRHYMTTEEAGLVDRMEILSLLEKTVSHYGWMSAVSLTGNTMVVKVETPDLDTVATLQRELEAVDYVVDVTVYTADKNRTEETEPQAVESTILVELSNAGWEAEE